MTGLIDPRRKALSIQQPYAFAVTMGFKPVENRDWKPTNPGLKFRGPVLIHAGLREIRQDVDGVLRRIADQTGESYAVIAGGYKSHCWLGAIVGAVTIDDCVTQHDSPWFNGPYAFVMSNPKWSNRVDCKGALGFFTVPDEVLAKLHVPPYWDALAVRP